MSREWRSDSVDRIEVMGGVRVVACAGRATHRSRFAIGIEGRTIRTATALIPMDPPLLLSRFGSRAAPVLRDGSMPFPTADTVRAQLALARRVTMVFEAPTTFLELAAAPERTRPLPNTKRCVESAVVEADRLIIDVDEPVVVRRASFQGCGEARDRPKKRTQRRVYRLCHTAVSMSVSTRRG